MAAWKIVALTLAGVLVAGLLFIGGFVTGVLTADVATSGGAPGGQVDPSGGGSTSGGVAPGNGSSAGGGPIDKCLVGSWKTTEYEHRVATPQGETVMTDLNRTFTFAASGEHVVTYDNVVAKSTVNGETRETTFNGKVIYAVQTNNGAMSFNLKSVEGTTTIGGKPEQIKPGTDPVTYTCSGDTYTESSKGYKEVATRVK